MSRRQSRWVPSASLILVATSIAACGYLPGLGPRVDIPAGLGERMTVEQVVRVVRASVVEDTIALGYVIRPFRVTSIRLVAPFERVRTTRPDGSVSVLSFSTDDTTWVVEAEGTFRDCASICSTYWSGVVVVDDARGQIVGRIANGPRG